MIIQINKMFQIHKYTYKEARKFIKFVYMAVYIIQQQILFSEAKLLKIHQSHQTRKLRFISFPSIKLSRKSVLFAQFFVFFQYDLVILLNFDYIEYIYILSRNLLVKQHMKMCLFPSYFYNCAYIFPIIIISSDSILNRYKKCSQPHSLFKPLVLLKYS